MRSIFPKTVWQQYLRETSESVTAVSQVSRQIRVSETGCFDISNTCKLFLQQQLLQQSHWQTSQLITHNLSNRLNSSSSKCIKTPATVDVRKICVDHFTNKEMLFQRQQKWQAANVRAQLAYSESSKMEESNCCEDQSPVPAVPAPASFQHVCNQPTNTIQLCYINILCSGLL